MSRSFSPMFSSRSFVVSGLTFKSLIHFDLIFAWYKICVQFHSLANGYPVFPTLFLEQTILSPPCILGALVKSQLTVHVWVYFCALYSIPLVYMSTFKPVPYTFHCYSFVVLSEVWEAYASFFVLFVQDCFGNSGSFMVP